ncbi:putative oligopeptidase B transcription factor WD40-like family [Helianthus annuus]|nr:putative oligopeptidase B transcription factor WD40-like family [Helianthus annuus]
MASFVFFITKTTRLKPTTRPLTTTLHSYFYSSLRHQTPPPPPSLQPPPEPKKVPFNVTAHGVCWEDPYHWMSNTHDPDLLNYLKHENDYSEAFMSDTRNLQSSLFSEMVRRLPHQISTPPERWGPWLYYQCIPEKREYPMLCRKLAVENTNRVQSMINYAKRGFSNEEILLDWNEIARENGYVHVGTCRISPDHRFLAYTIDTTGEEQFLLQVKDLQTGTVIPTFRVEGVVSVAWAQDSCTLFYTLCDQSQRPYRVQYTTIGFNPVSNVIAYTEEDSRFCVDITNTKDGKFITVYVVDANNPKDGLRKVHDRVSDVQFFLEHDRGFFYILTNLRVGDENGSLDGNYYLARCRVEDVQSANWEKVIVPAKGTRIQDMDVFYEHLVLYLNKEDSPMICSFKMPIQSNNEKEMEIDDLDPWRFPMPENSCSVNPGSNHDFMNSVYRVVLSSPVMPDIVVDYNMSTRTFSIVHQEDVLGISSKPRQSEAHEWINISNSYFCERKEVMSHDGTIVPLTILYSRKAHKMCQSPGIIHGYGSYGEVLEKSWSAERLSLLDRGWVVAFADVRGGAGSDPSWHKNGSGLHKLNSINDFISCGKYLINEGYVHKDQLGAIGHSAGGLLVAAAINMHPNLFKAAILKVPFLDICNTLLDPSLPLTVLDYEEFGNPRIKSHFDSIMKYSPYDNINRGTCYPAMLLTASFYDSRVGVWEAAKYVSRIREHTCSSCSGSVILKTNMSGGHFGEGGRTGQCEELAYEYAFLMKVMGIVIKGASCTQGA